MESIPLLRISEGHTERGQASFHNLISPRDMNNDALPGGSYVRWKEFQIWMKLYYSVAFIYFKDILLYRLCMNFSHLQE